MKKFGPQPKFIRQELLLHPNIPKPLHGCAPRVVLGQDWWDIERWKAYEQNNNCCWACGVYKVLQKGTTKYLEAHEVYDINYAKGRMKLVEIVALCHYCHNYIHSGRLAILNEQGEVSTKEMNAIMNHGDLITEALDRPDPPMSIASWEKWRMEIGGKLYGPTSPSFEAWERGAWKNWSP